MKALLALLILATTAAMPATAAADGLPLPIEDVGPAGVAADDGVYRYVTIPSGDDTLLQQIHRDGGVVADYVRLDGRYTIPAVALDGSPGGLSANGETLVLIRPRVAFPRESTEFLRVDTDRLRREHRFTLDGDFSFDALSPDGRTMYLINYTSRRDPTQYDVRAFDLARERLVGGPIVDPNESGEEMYGYALSRVTGEDGRWEYTLYQGSEHPFIHALDVKSGTAACIDLDDVHARDMYALGLEPGDPGQLVVEKRGAPVAFVDAETHAVTEPPNPAASQPEDSSAFPTVAVFAIAAGVALLAASLTLGLRHRRRAVA